MVIMICFVILREAYTYIKFCHLNFPLSFPPIPLLICGNFHAKLPWMARIFSLVIFLFAPKSARRNTNAMVVLGHMVIFAHARQKSVVKYNHNPWPVLQALYT